MMQSVDRHLAGYDLEPAVRVLTAFMEKLTNWYLRRSRRRFRATGMDADKQSAYRTLFHVIGTYCQVAAPCTPFVSEWIWQEMHAFIAGESKGSIHLTMWPFAHHAYINKKLIAEIAQVRRVIKAAMYLRAKHQIKVKQPLPVLRFKI